MCCRLEDQALANAAGAASIARSPPPARAQDCRAGANLRRCANAVEPPRRPMDQCSELALLERSSAFVGIRPLTPCSLIQRRSSASTFDASCQKPLQGRGQGVTRTRGALVLWNAGRASLLPAYAALDRAAPQLHAHIRRVLQQPLQVWGQGAVSPNYLF